MATTMAMFPLGTVLFPTMVLPLHIFEDRYRQMVRDCLDDSSEFGVCLIERGSEVGGGEVRTDIGTVAQIVDAQQFDDGRWALAAVGTRRLRVVEWLSDDPYPRALVDEWPENPAPQDLSGLRDVVVHRLRTVLDLHHAMGLPGAPSDTAIDSDPALAGYQVATLSPLGSFDRQKLLVADDAGARLTVLDQLLAEVESDLRSQQDLR
jgi:Lon protease-like protein